MAQWEMCRAALVTWVYTFDPYKKDPKLVLDYYTPTGVITKFLSIDLWGQVLATLGVAEWEAIAIESGFGDVVIGHPSGDKDWLWQSCNAVAYFKRPIQAGRKIDDAL